MRVNWCLCVCTFSLPVNVPPRHQWGLQTVSVCQFIHPSRSPESNSKQFCWPSVFWNITAMETQCKHSSIIRNRDHTSAVGQQLRGCIVPDQATLSLGSFHFTLSNLYLHQREPPADQSHFLQSLHGISVHTNSYILISLGRLSVAVVRTSKAF